MIKAIVNASPLIALSIIRQFNLLKQIFNEIYIPKAVADEILAAESKKHFAVNELKQAINNDIFKVYTVKDSKFVGKLFGKLHKGELEVIVGAKELDVDFAVIDEIAARRLAKILGVDTIGTIGILMLAKEKGYIPHLKPLLLELKSNKFRLSDKLMKKILLDVKEK
ncbi:MAG: DUF3368 domain-containing protein [Bacteroidetes bacterium]|nr:MAG: DUF3368 domain-containing protein [Bacteroidota bacterium]